MVVLIWPLIFPSTPREVSPTASPEGPTPAETTPVEPTVSPEDTPPLTLPSEIPAPDLVGLSEQEARERLEQFGLEYAKGRDGCDPYIEHGFVMAQEPPFGTYLSRGDVVTVSLGARSGLARVPPVLQMSFEGAKLRLENACFRVVRENVGCTGTPVGRVHRQDPQGGFQEMQRFTVTLYVSAGDDATMPELLRVSLAEARQRVEEAGLVWGYPNPQTQADMLPGVIIGNLGAPGEVISYVVTYNGTRRTSGELNAGDEIPCGARVDVAYNATQP
jgi:serine/threonine-protein kinase